MWDNNNMDQDNNSLDQYKNYLPQYNSTGLLPLTVWCVSRIIEAAI